MNTITLIIIIAAVVLFLLIVAIIFIRRSNRKRFKRLQENLNKYKSENENFGSDDKVTIAEDDFAVNTSIDTPVEHNDIKNSKNEPIIEDYVLDEPAPMFGNKTIKMTRPEKKDFYSQKKFNPETKLDSASANIVNDDFEEFMNEHSYTRRILDNDIMNKLKRLPPEVKAIILSNVFNKHDD